MKNYSVANLLQNSLLILFVLFSLTLANAQDFYSSKMVSCSAGGNHSMAIDELGYLWAWGSNQSGQLGDGTAYNQKFKPELAFSFIKIKTVSAGYGFTILIDKSGNLWSVGINLYGQLGNGDSGYNSFGDPKIKATPKQIETEIKFQTVSAGFCHSLAIDESGNIWAWGANNWGQLGDGTISDKTKPIKIQSGVRFKSVSAGNKSLAIDGSGNLWTWGGYYKDSTSYIKSPLHIKPGIKFTSISAGPNHNFAIDESGNLWAWGNNENGILGDGTKASKSEAVIIQSDIKFKYASAGNSFSLAIDEFGNIWAWGLNEFGQLGNGEGGVLNNQENSYIPKCELSPVKIDSNVKFHTVSAGITFSMAIDENGNQWVWGDNRFGQLGFGNAVLALQPVSIENGTQFGMISAGSQHSSAIDLNGHLMVWGYNNTGQLGDSTYSSKSSPVMIKSDILFNIISLGDHSLALDKSGNIWGWGKNHSGQLGGGTLNFRNVPEHIKSDTKFNYISAGKEYSMAIDNSGNLWAWGENYRGQLGSGSNATEYSAVKVKPEIKFQKISAGGTHTLAIDEFGNLWSWGFNDEGQLGDGTKSNKNSPIQIMQGTKFLEISAGSAEYGGHSLAIDNTGNLWAWGCNSWGQLGFDSLMSISSPILINPGMKFKKVSAGYRHTLVIDNFDNLWACGNNSSGQLGDGTTISNKKLCQIKSDKKFKTVSAGNNHSMAIDDSNTLWAWGSNTCGKLGDGTAWSEVPICINNPSLYSIAILPKSIGIKAYGSANQIVIQSETPETFTLYNLMGGKVAKGKLQPAKPVYPFNLEYIFSVREDTRPSCW